jgi:hypothetical protein
MLGLNLLKSGSCCFEYFCPKTLLTFPLNADITELRLKRTPEPDEPLRPSLASVAWEFGSALFASSTEESPNDDLPPAKLELDPPPDRGLTPELGDPPTPDPLAAAVGVSDFVSEEVDWVGFAIIFAMLALSFAGETELLLAVSELPPPEDELPTAEGVLLLDPLPEELEELGGLCPEFDNWSFVFEHPLIALVVLRLSWLAFVLNVFNAVTAGVHW